jgi:PAS domain S-box-containing protein
MRLKENKIRILHIFAFFLFSIMAVVWIRYTYEQKKTSYYSKLIDELRSGYSSIVSSYRDAADVIFKSCIDRPEVLGIYKKALSKDEHVRKLVRRQLLSELGQLYEILKLNDVQNLHFHLPDNESFLRFHSLDKHGDSLSGIRYSVEKANSQLVTVAGFEQGRMFDGFRNVFPIVYNNEHLGSVEISINLKAIHKKMEKRFSNKYAFIINPRVVNNEDFGKGNTKYGKSDISDFYFYERDYLPNKDLQATNAQIRPEIQDNLKAGEGFAVEGKAADGHQVVVFSPIKNAEGKQTAYIISYTKDDTITKYYNEYIIFAIASVSGIFIIVALFYLLSRTNRALLDEKERFKAIVDSAEDIIFIKDIHHRYTLANPAFEMVFGLSSDGLLGKTHDALFQERQLETKEIDNQVFSGRRIKGESERHIRGKLHYFDVIKVPLRDSLGKIIGLCGISRDITARKQVEQELKKSNEQLKETLKELKNAQEQMLQQERLAVVGQLSAGIAHDFNNILAAILGYSELLLLSPDTPKSIRSKLQKIASSSQRAAFLVSQLLDFSRKSVRQLEDMDLAVFMKESVEFLERTIPENIHITLDIAPGDYLLEADATQMQQMVTNLAINARDAMPDGGRLEIKLSQIETSGQERCVGCGQAISGKWIYLTVSDNGHGMEPETLSRIFEPFFTTKEVGMGTGLGLSQVYGIVKQHDGHLTSWSELGQGTTIRIYLPFLATQANGAIEKKISMLKGQGEKILLLEGDPILMEISKELLENLNYKVLVSSSGHDAIGIYEKNMDEVALVISDMNMPDIMGDKLFQKFKALNPEIKMVIMTSYPLEKKGLELLREGLVAWFEKPLSLQKLSNIMDQASFGAKNRGRWS